MLISKAFYLVAVFVGPSFQHVIKSSSKFSQQYPTLNPHWKVLKELGTPLPLPKDGSSDTLSKVWLKSNPLYGALLWKNKIIDSLAFIFNQSKSVPNSSAALFAMQLMFSEIDSMHTIANKDYPKEKLGCVAGHLFLYEQGKIKNFTDLSRDLEKNCQKSFTPDNLSELINPRAFDMKNRFLMEDFLPSVISAYVWSSCRQLKTPEAAVSLLKNYRKEFFNAIKFKHVDSSGKSLVNNEAVSMVEQDLDQSIVNLQHFTESFEVLCDSFVQAKIPTEIEFITNVAFNGVTWANCVETAFTNWLIGTAYNAEDHSFGLSRITTKSNPILAKIFEGNNGFESCFRHSVFSSAYQNLPFVIYSQMKITSDQKILADSIDNALGFVVVPHDYYEQLSSDNSNEVPLASGSEVVGKKIQKSDSDEACFVFVDRERYPDIFLYEVASRSVNFVLLAFYLDNDKVTTAFKSAQDIFEIFYTNDNCNVETFENRFILGECIVLPEDGSIRLEFEFGDLSIFENHSYFEFTRENTHLKLDLLQKDSLIKTIAPTQTNLNTHLDKTIWSFLHKKQISWHEEVFQLGIPLLSYIEKLDLFGSKDSLALYIVQNPTSWELGYSFPYLRKLFVTSCELIANDIIEFGNDSEILFLLSDQLSDSDKIKAFIPVYSLYASHPNGLEQFKMLISKNIFPSITIYDMLISKRVPLLTEVVKFIIIDLKNYTADQLENASKLALKVTLQYHSISEGIIAAWKLFKSSFPSEFWNDFCEKFKNAALKDSKEFSSLYAAFAIHFDLDLEFIREIADHEFNCRFNDYFFLLHIEEDEMQQLVERFGSSKFLAGMNNAGKIEEPSS